MEPDEIFFKEFILYYIRSSKSALLYKEVQKLNHNN